MRLLLVEDDQNLSDAIAEQLQKEGYGNTAQKKVPNTAECDIIKSWINK